MEPRVQYVKTSDGVNIAYWAIGQGPALVLAPPLNFSHIQLEWQIPLLREWYEELARSHRVIRFDGRGWGLSERKIRGLDIGLTALDIDAIVEQVGVATFALAGFFAWGPSVISYAATRPERVSHLVMWCSSARSEPWRAGSGNQLQAATALTELDWDLFTSTLARVALGWGREEDATWFTMFIRESVTQDFVLSWQEHYLNDASSSLQDLRCPALLMHRRKFPIWPMDGSLDMAARIPGAQLMLLEGGSPLLHGHDRKEILTAIESFLGIEVNPFEDARTPSSGVVRTILFTDIVGHTEMMQRLGDEKAREVLREHERITREVLKWNGGTEVKTLGDGFMASFGSVTKAVECAVSLQRAFEEHNTRTAEPLSVRVGLNAGEPIEEDGDLFGSTVILAARIASAAKGGEVLASIAVRELCSGKGFLFADRGEFVAKGFEEPVRMYEVNWHHTTAS